MPTHCHRTQAPKRAGRGAHDYHTLALEGGVPAALSIYGNRGGVVITAASKQQYTAAVTTSSPRRTAITVQKAGRRTSESAGFC